MSVVPQPQTPAVEPASISILVVDDTEANRDVLARRLQRRGYAVTSASDGAEALAKTAAQPFDLILLDVMMPGISGLDVLRQLRERFDLTELPIIMATAKDRSEDVVTALDLGANDYVTKPLDFDVVMARVRTHTMLQQSIRQIKELESRLEQRAAQLETMNQQLQTAATRTEKELALAARVQEQYLPPKDQTVAGLSVAWEFRPSSQLAGDSLNVVPLNQHQTAIYVLDVAGHGAAAALQAVAATRLLSLGHSSILVDAGGVPFAPHEVLNRLNDSFGWNPATEQFLTVVYCLFDDRTKELAYCSAGHPPPIRVDGDGLVKQLEGSGLPIGFGDGYKTTSVTLRPGERVYLYSDGAIEAKNAELTLFGLERLMAAIAAARPVALDKSIEQVIAEIYRFNQDQPVGDDLSIVAIECR